MHLTILSGIETRLCKLNSLTNQGKLQAEISTKLFTASSREYNDLGGLLTVFQSIATDLHKAVVLGVPSGELATGNPAPRKDNLQRQKVRLFTLDIDHIPIERKDKNPAQIGLEVLELLGLSELKQAGYIFQYTPSYNSVADTGATLSIRLWYIIDTATDLDSLKAFFAAKKDSLQAELKPCLDLAVFNHTQLIFTANLYNHGNPDPEPHRWHVVEGGMLDAKLFARVPITSSATFNQQPAATINQPQTPLSTTLSDVKKLLDNISDNNSYDNWLAVGMAVHKVTQGSEQGLKLWDDWSKSSAEYKPQVTTTKWQTFKTIKDNGNLRGMPYLQRQAGRGDVADKNSLNYFLTNFIYVQTGDCVFNLQRPAHVATCKMNEFRNAFANVFYETQSPNDPNKLIYKPMARTWLEAKERKTAQDITYHPAKATAFYCDDGLLWLNSYYAPSFAYTDKTDLLTPFFNHMAYLCPIEAEREWLISWIAFNVQRPAERCKVTPLHVSHEHGTGRGWLVQCLEALLGDWNCKKTKMNILCGEGSGGAFQDYFNNSVLCCIEEVREGNKRYEISDKIRDLLTEPRLEVNSKYGKKATQQVFTNFFMMTNHNDAIALPQEDRRINVLTGAAHKKDTDYFNALYKWLEDEKALAQLYWHLNRLDLTKFEWQTSMDTPARAIMIANTTSELELALRDLLETEYTFLHYGQIEKFLKQSLSSDAFGMEINSRQLKLLLGKYCTYSGGKTIKVNGKNIRPWCLKKGVAFNDEAVRQSCNAFDIAWQGN